MLQARINRMNRCTAPKFGSRCGQPSPSHRRCHICEDKHNILKVQVPGIDEKDIDVRIQNNTLTVQGERMIEKEEKEKNSVASSGDTEALPARSHMRGTNIQLAAGITHSLACWIQYANSCPTMPN